MLMLRDIGWSFFDGVEINRVLQHVNLTLEGSRCCAVTGPSGCGKTTLLTIISLFRRPTEGNLYVQGKDLTGASEAQARAFRRLRMGLVFQSSRLFETLSVSEHIRFMALMRARRELQQIGSELVEQLGLSHAFSRLPQELSGGEKQRLALALVLMNEPELVLADEPTAALDETNATIVARTVRDFCRQTGATAVLATHDPIVIDLCDFAITLSGALEAAQPGQISRACS